MNNLVFVYGTLKSGFHNHELLSKATKIDKARTLNPFYRMYNLGPHPAVSNNFGAYNYIIGELYEVDEDTMKDLDILEEYPNMYQRSLVEVVDFEQSIYLAWMYTMSESKICHRPIVPGGIWK